MRLTLTITSGPEGLGAAETRQVGCDPFSIGRAADNDWVLADPERHLSKRHCRISFRDTFWEVTDLSTNGTFLNREPIGNRGVRDLHDGDRLRLGSYEIAVALGQDLPASQLTDASRMVDPFSLTGFPAPLHGPVSGLCRRPASPPPRRYARIPTGATIQFAA
jgi:type VI secretion system FHA domain protein